MVEETMASDIFSSAWVFKEISLHVINATSIDFTKSPFSSVIFYLSLFSDLEIQFFKYPPSIYSLV